MENINPILEEINHELKLIKNLKHIEVLDLSIHPMHFQLKQLLHFWVQHLNLKVLGESSISPSMNVSFQEDMKKIYHLSIHLFLKNNEPSLILSVQYYATEHHSIHCNRMNESIGELILNHRSDDEIVKWMLSLRGKTKNVNCYYCGEINIQH
jgi:hypothetical protein